MGIGSSIFVDPSDRFADYIKASLSLKSLLINSSGSLNYSEWPQIFIGYLQNNPYLEYPLSSPGLTIFHHPPLTFNYFQSTAILLSYGFTPYELIIFNLLTLLCLFIVILRICFKQLKFKKPESVFILLVLFLGFPTLFAIDRGNFQSVYCSTLFIIGSLLMQTKNASSSVCLALALNIRPNILISLIPLIDIKHENLKFLLRIFFISLTIAIGFYFLDNYLSPYYGPTTFFDSLNYYKIHYILGKEGDAYNSSLHSLSKLLMKKGINYYLFFYSLLLVIIIFSYIGFKKYNNISSVKSFIGCSFCMMLTPTFADYHLLFFVLPLILAIHDFHMQPKLSYLVAFSSIFIMAPKLGIIIGGFTLNTIFNPIIGILTLILIFDMSFLERLNNRFGFRGQ